MELLKLILFSTAFSFLSASAFFDLIIFTCMLKLVYKKNNMYINLNDADPMMIMMNLMNIMMHLVFYQLTIFIQVLKQNKYGNYVITTYSNLNQKYLELRNIVFNFVLLKPLKVVLKKIIGPLMINYQELKPTEIPKMNKSLNVPDVNLNNNKDINDFLDKILENNKKD